MSYYYLLSPTVNSYTQLQPIYYLPAQFQQSLTNLPVINATNPSQLEDNQNFILSLNMPTRDSLQLETDQKPKTPKKKMSIKKEKDENFGWRNQNKDRNILSNILKAFMNYLLQNEGMRKYLQYLHEKLDLQNGVSAFIGFLQRNFPLTKSYISPKQLKTFLKDPAHPASLLMVLKLALVRFLNIDYSLILLKSNKIKRRSKLEQMKKSRDLIYALFRE